MNILNNEIINDLIKNEPKLKYCKFKKNLTYSSRDIAINSTTQKSNENSIIFNVNKNLILKIQKVPNLNEIKFQIRASDIDLSPLIYEVYECKIEDKIISYAFIMDELDTTVKEYMLDDKVLFTDKYEILNKIIKKLTKLNSIDIRHNDSLLRNFMIKSDDVYIIDFDRSISTFQNPLASDFNRLYVDLIDEFCPDNNCKDIATLKALLSTLERYIDRKKIPKIIDIPKSVEEILKEEKEKKEREEERKKEEEERKKEKEESGTPKQQFINDLFVKYKIDQENCRCPEKIDILKKLLKKKFKDMNDSDMNVEIEKAIKYFIIW